MTKDRRLGKGLAALLGTPLESDGLDSQSSHEFESTSATAVASDSRPGIKSLEIDVELIDANPFQPRREFNPEEIESLAESLKSHQQLQPILVRAIGDRYQLISGERRLRATRHAGLPTIRAEIRSVDDRLVSELAIIENLQRKDLNAIEKAMSFKRYIAEHRCTQEELANRLKIDRSTIANFMRLLELPQKILDQIQREETTFGHGRAVLTLSTEAQQIAMIDRAIRDKWTVREIERRVAEQVAQEQAEELGMDGVASRQKAPSRSDHLAAMETHLKRCLGTRVDIHQTTRGKGRITIHFTDAQEFERLRAMLESPVVPLRAAA